MSEESNHPHRWALLAGAWALYAGFGMVIGAMAPLVTAIAEDLDLSKSAIGSVLGAWPLAYLFVAIPAGTLVDRLGLRWSLAAGGVAVAVSGLLRAAASGWWTLFAAVAVFGLGGPLVSVGTPKLVRQLFGPADRAMAMGVLMTAPPVGMAFTLATANSLVMPALDDEWRAALAFYGALAAAAIGVWLIVSRRARDELGPTPVASRPTRGEWHRLLSSGSIRLLLVLAVATFFFNHAINNWLPTVLTDEGLGETTAGYVASASVVVGIAGSLTIPRLATPRRRLPVLGATLGSAVAAAMTMAFVDGAASIAPAVVIGFAKSGFVPVMLVFVMAAPGIHHGNMGVGTGLFFTAGEIGGFLGPLLIGVVADATGSFDAPMAVMAGLAAFMALLVVLVDRDVRATEVRSPAPVDIG